jgi:ribosomal RNA-processing protein 36
MHRPVKLRHDESEEDESSSSSEAGTDSHTETSSSGSSDSRPLGYATDEEDWISSSNPYTETWESSDPIEEDPDVNYKRMSFGALKQAQSELDSQPRKRKLPQDFDEPQKDTAKPLAEIQASKKPKESRQSKHAPTILSSKQQVSRKRDIFEPSPAIKSRDPRFDPTVQASNHDRNAVDKANKNYSFLSSYQAAEILDLKSQIKKAKDPDTIAELKKRVMAIENRARAVEAKQRERDISKKHKEKEKEAIRSGEKSKPFFLKPGEVKKLAQQERLDSMGAKARDKALQRKRKREKSKESRNMPRARRE